MIGQTMKQLYGKLALQLSKYSSTCSLHDTGIEEEGINIENKMTTGWPDINGHKTHKKYHDEWTQGVGIKVHNGNDHSRMFAVNGY